MKNAKTDQKHKAHKAKTRGKKIKKRKEKIFKKKRKQSGTTALKYKINVKAFEYKTGLKFKIKSARATDLIQKKYHMPLLNKSAFEPSPHIVVVQGPPKVGKTTLIKCLLRHYTRQVFNDINGPVTLVTGKNQRITFIECPNDINCMIDCAKIADVALLMVDASFGFEMETFEFLNLLQSHGFPKVLTIASHYDTFTKLSHVSKAKKKLRKRLESELYPGAKIFNLTGFRNNKYLHNEVKNLARIVSNMKIRPISWRIEHSYILVDRFEDNTMQTKVLGDPKCDRNVVFYGYLRGSNFRKGTRVHIAGIGDFDIESVEALDDPCPLRHKKEKDDKRLMYSPMNDFAGFFFDKDNTYIHIPNWKVKKSEMAEGKEMVKDLQKTKNTFNSNLDKKKLKLFEKGTYVDTNELEPIKIEEEENRQLLEQVSSDENDDDDDDDDEGLGMAGVWKQNIVSRAQKLFGEKLDLNKYVYDEITKEQDINELEINKSKIDKTIMTKYENFDYNALKNRFTTGDWKVAAERKANIDNNDDEEEEEEGLDIDILKEDDDEAIKAGKEAVIKEEKRNKKALFDTEYDQAGGGKAVAEKEEELKEITIEDLYNNEKKKKSYYEAVKEDIDKKYLNTQEALSRLTEEERVMMEGFRPGSYLRIKLKNVPCELVEFFNKSRPIVIGGLNATDEKYGIMIVRLKKHRWYPKILKTKDPLICSIGWRRFQSLPIYAVEDHNKRVRMLKYTPEHAHCLAVIYGPVAAANSGFVGIQHLSSDLQNWRISVTGVVTEINTEIKIVKKLKLIGTPSKIHDKTAFISGMFNSKLEVCKFEGASIKTVSGIRGFIKKAIREGHNVDYSPGSFRASFEDNIIMSDIVFLRTWIKVEIPRFCITVKNLLYKYELKNINHKRSLNEDINTEGEIVIESNSPEFIASDTYNGFRPGYVFKTGDLGLGYYIDTKSNICIKSENISEFNVKSSLNKTWQGMRTVAEIRRSLGIGAPVKIDSFYRDVERVPRLKKNVNIPKNLIARLPYKDKPKPKEPKIEDFLKKHKIIIREPSEKRVSDLFDQVKKLDEIRKEKLLAKLQENKKKLRREEGKEDKKRKKMKK